MFCWDPGWGKTGLVTEWQGSVYLRVPKTLHHYRHNCSSHYSYLSVTINIKNHSDIIQAVSCWPQRGGSGSTSG